MWLITTILDSTEIVEIKSEPYCTHHSNKNKFQVNSGLNLRNKVIKILEENMQYYAYLALVSSFYPPAMQMADKGLISVYTKSFGKLASEQKWSEALIEQTQMVNKPKKIFGFPGSQENTH